MPGHSSPATPQRDRVVERLADIFVLVVEPRIDFVEAALLGAAVAKPAPVVEPLARWAAVASAGEFAVAIGAHRTRVEAELEAAQFAAIGPLARSLRQRGTAAGERDEERQRAGSGDRRYPPHHAIIVTVGRLCAPTAAHSQSEHVQHMGHRDVLELGRLPHHSGTLARSNQHRDVLLSVDRIGDRRCVDAGADVVAPDLLQCLGIISRERPVEMTGEHQIARGSEHARIGRIGELGGDLGFAGGRVDRLEAAVAALTGLGFAAAEALTRLQRAALIHEALLFDGLDDIAALDRGDEQKIELWMVGARRPVLATGVRRAGFALGTGARAVAAFGVGLNILARIVVERLAGFRVEAGRPGHVVGILLAQHERAVQAVERVIEAVARYMHDELALLAVDLGVDNRVLRDLVEVVRIVWRVLEAPPDLAVGWIECEHARRPFVVARAVFGIVIGAGIADALVKRVAVGIVGAGFPDRAAAVLPTLQAVFPCLVAGFAGARDSVGAPKRLAGIEVGSFDEAADAVFAAGGTDNGDVSHDQRRVREGLADGGVGDLALPHLFAGLFFEHEQAATERDRDDLVLPQRDAAIVDAAAGDVGGPSLVGLGIELPTQHAAPPA